MVGLVTDWREYESGQSKRNREKNQILRMSEGLTQEKLDDEFHYSTKAMISDWETGRRWISLECLVMYSER